MTFLITNDDGIDSPGIRTLSNAINGEKIIVAPKNALSGCGHKFTIKTPIQVEKKAHNEYGVDGTPVDCTRIGIFKICPEVKWVLSGINLGDNLGVETYTSGTVAGAREAAILGIPSIAISHFTNSALRMDWDLATQLTQTILADLLTRELPLGCFWNVNIPHLPPNSKKPEIIFSECSIDPLHIDYKIEDDLYFYTGKYPKRKSTINTDVDVCFNGDISVSMIKV